MSLLKKCTLTILLIVCTFISTNILARTRTINLVVAYKTVHFAEKTVQAIAVNNQIPAPPLHFTEGDHVVINVTNHLNEGTIIHWHGIILPWQMDGVEGVSQPAIQPGKTFHYHFTIRQAGTFWYHAHAGFQEQQGVYGAFIIEPKGSHTYQYTKDEPIVLSDWSNTNPNQIYANLKKEGDYYSPRFPLQASLVKFIRDYKKANSAERKQLWRDYLSMQKSRMSIYDFSDVAYDAFLINGQTVQHPWKKLVKVGDVVRLRFIDAGASTNFHIKIPGGDMTIIGVDGNDIKPEKTHRFFITPGETYDVLIKIKNKNPVVIYAESADTLGYAIGALITHPAQVIQKKNIVPFPEPLPVTQEMMNNMMPEMHHGSMKMTESSEYAHTHSTMSSEMKMNDSHDMHHMKNRSHDNSDHLTKQSMPIHNTKSNKSDMSMDMSMPTEPSMIGDHLEQPTKALLKIKTSGTKYQNIIASKKTNNPKDPVYRVIRMELFGYMDRYIWMINGLPEYKAKPIILIPGKRYRFIFTNTTMMHHPMHIHGHWFILRNGHGDFDPLLHTIDVAPGAIAVADVDTDASGQWFFHCHQLYHMMAGMARVIQYQTIIDVAHGKRKPQRKISTTGYYNRPIVRVDEETPLIPALIHHPMGHPTRFYTTNFLDVGEDVTQNIQQISFKGLYGGDYNKLELYTDTAQIEKGKVDNADMDILYWRLISQFWAVQAGVNYFNQPANTPYWQPALGIEGLMPYFIDTNLRAYFYRGSVKFDIDLSRDTQITNNFFIRLGVESTLATKTVSNAAIASGLNEMEYTLRPYYRIAPGFNIFAQYRHTKDYGALSRFDLSHNESVIQNSYTAGIALLF